MRAFDKDTGELHLGSRAAGRRIRHPQHLQPEGPAIRGDRLRRRQDGDEIGRRVCSVRASLTGEDEPIMMLAHDVFFTLHDASEKARKALVDACLKYLSGYPGCISISTGIEPPSTNGPSTTRPSTWPFTSTSWTRPRTTPTRSTRATSNSSRRAAPTGSTCGFSTRRWARRPRAGPDRPGRPKAAESRHAHQGDSTLALDAIAWNVRRHEDGPSSRERHGSLSATEAGVALQAEKRFRAFSGPDSYSRSAPTVRRQTGTPSPACDRPARPKRQPRAEAAPGCSSRSGRS